MYKRKLGEMISVDTVVLWPCLKLSEMKPHFKAESNFSKDRCLGRPLPCLIFRRQLKSLCFFVAGKLFAQVNTNHRFYLSERRRRRRKTKTNMLELFLTSPWGSVVRTPLSSSILCHFILFNGL